MAGKAYFDFTTLLRSKSEIAGIWGSVFLGQGGDISHIRPYQPGDKLRSIHRPSFFRGELMTKEFFGERRMAIRLIFDVGSSITPTGKFYPITAKAARDAVELFSDLIQGAADFWGIPVSRTNAFRDLRRGSLVFFVSDFYEGPEDYNAFFGECRNARVDLIPVLIDTSWIWRELQKSNAEISGIDVGEGKEAGTVSTGKKAFAQKEAAFTEREARLGGFLKRQNMPWINLKKPEFSDYVREMTRCFSEKYRTSA
ncbi:MAG: DUF58 domain-containing protein [Candidatus Spechtbacterales bacterium]